MKPGIETAPPSHRRASLVAALVLGGGGLVLGGVGLGFELLAKSSYNDAKAATANATRDSKYDSADTQRHVAQGFAVAGALSVGAAVWLYVRGRHAEDNRTTGVATPAGLPWWGGSESFMLLVVLVGACDFGRLPQLNDDAGIDAAVDAPTDAVPATKLLLASGNNQRGMPGVALHAPFAVTVEDASGNPVSGFMVAFAVTAGSGSVSSASVATDAQGQAQTTLTPGTSGANTVEASGTGLAGSPIVFAAAAGFDVEVEFPVGVSPGFPAIGDVNGDGQLDIMVNSANDSTLSVLLNTAAIGATAPGFAPRSVLDMPGLPLGVAIGDLNGDGKPDVAAASFPNSTVAVYLNTTATGATAASFTRVDDVQVGTHPADLAIGDLNGDGVPDIALADSGAASVSVLINHTTTGSATPSLVRK